MTVTEQQWLRGYGGLSPSRPRFNPTGTHVHHQEGPSVIPVFQKSATLYVGTSESLQEVMQNAKIVFFLNTMINAYCNIV